MLGLLTKCIHLEIDHYYYWMLGVAVWIIYAVDHLLDVRFIKYPSSLFSRYAFFLNHQLILWICVLIGSSSLLVCCYQLLDKNIFIFGLLISSAGGIHYLLNVLEKRFHDYLGKEFRIAIIYVMGVSISLWMHISTETIKMFIWLLSSVFLITLLNLMIVADIDKEQDLEEQQISLPLFVSDQWMRWILIFIYILNLIVIRYVFIFEKKLIGVGAIFLLMLGLHVLLDLNRNFLRKKKIHRLFSEAIYFCPVIYLVT